MSKTNVSIIGLGGIGSQLCEPICRYINYLENVDDFIVTLIDGDMYESSNRTRQTISINDIGESKSKIQHNKMIDLFSKLNIIEKSIYINSVNMKDCFHESDNNLILLGVDNHKTRKLVQDYCSGLNNVLLISGGNNWIDGDVLIYARKNGVSLTPTIYEYNPEIYNYTDKSPEEMGCDELEKSEPQLIFTNGMVAMCMQMCFYNYYQIFDNEKITIFANEVMFDIEEMRSVTKSRKINKTFKGDL